MSGLLDICLHGQVDTAISYHATIAGADLGSRFFHETIDVGGEPATRFFSGGNEIVLGQRGISCRGNGGAFCEYMFGVEQSLTDLMRPDVKNRLVIYGAYFAPILKRIIFTDRTEGSDSYDQVFLNGNALVNYYFFVQWNVGGRLRYQQEILLRRVGRVLKRTANVEQENDTALAQEILAEIGDPRALLFLFRLTHIPHKQYADAVRDGMAREGSGKPGERAEMLASNHTIDLYQQERINIDAVYRIPENRVLVDQYREILIRLRGKENADPKAVAQLSRLRTLAIRQKVPSALFDSLDERLLTGKEVAPASEPSYLRETRAILEGLFLRRRGVSDRISAEDLLKLLKAKQQAVVSRDLSFEEILLHTCRAADEQQVEDDASFLESFGEIVTYFDRFDQTSNTINRMAFIEGSDLSEPALRGLLGHRQAFEAIEAGIFHALFIDPIRRDAYLTRYGARKIQALVLGLAGLVRGDLSVRDVVGEIGKAAEEERLYGRIRQYVKERVQTTYAELLAKDELDAFLHDLTNVLMAKKLIGREIPLSLVQRVILDLKKEAFYVNQFFPQILSARHGGLREDFIQNSGLDRFYVEELEREYCEVNKIDPAALDAIRR
ncbi:MAG: TIGR04442 family protein [Nitrospirae bacterium RBG_16_64_22]|nr:MAG: TIGR04442 family protein [Nitrospirae bacterium RBG_16_64_22]